MNQREFETFGHMKTLLRYHIIFSTKYRRDCLGPIRDIVINSFRIAESMTKSKILTMELDKDHIHMLVMIPPSDSVSKLIKQFKQYSTHYIYKDPMARVYLKKYYWKQNILWTHGAFVATIGAVSEETLRYYIENQG